MNGARGAGRSDLPLADLLAIALLFVFARVRWLVASFSYSDERAPAFVAITLLIAAAIVLSGYAFFRIVRFSGAHWVARAAVLAMFLFLLAGQLRQTFAPRANLDTPLLVAIALASLVLAGIGASFLARLWSRLRSAMLAGAFIATTSAFLLAFLLAPHLTLLSGSAGERHRPMVVLILDEFSAGAADVIASDLAGSGLHVVSNPVRSVGTNTIDAVPAILTGIRLGDARPCTDSAICGRGEVVDFARVNVGRDDVDIIGAYLPYCALSGLRHCEIPGRGLEGPVWNDYLCGLPIRLLLSRHMGCAQSGYAPPNAVQIEERTRQRLFTAPFWSRGGLLFAHVLQPHPPSPGNEPRLSDAYAANVSRVRELVRALGDRLKGSAYRDDFTIVVTSDHHLRGEFWCGVEPYSLHDCELPESWRSELVPFIVASSGGAVDHVPPRSNGDLLRVIDELSRPR